MREAGAGVANFGVAFEEAGGLSTKDVSVVLQILAIRNKTMWILIQLTRMLSLHQSRRETYPNLLIGL
jgi:hypothetical protein